MLVKFDLRRSTLHPENGRYLGADFFWILELRVTPETKDLVDFYVENIGVERIFPFMGASFNDLARIVFRRREEILPYIGVAEYVCEISERTRLHALFGQEPKRWFADLLSTLGELENISTR